MMTQTLLTHTFILLALAGIPWDIARALEGDRHATLEITADSAELNEQKGIAIYKGNVVLSQGSLLIKSKTLTIQQNESGVERVIATGKPAKYSQLLENEEQPATAQAYSITYFVDTQKIRLSGNALLKQAGSRFEGEQIEYDIENKILTASSENQKKASKKRVKMVLPPAEKAPKAQ